MVKINAGMSEGVRSKNGRRGLILAELLVAMVITGIILTAVATLSFAIGKANDNGDEKSRTQAQIRFATVKLTDMLGHCRTEGR